MPRRAVGPNSRSRRTISSRPVGRRCRGRPRPLSRLASSTRASWSSGIGRRGAIPSGAVIHRLGLADATSSAARARAISGLFEVVREQGRSVICLASPRARRPRSGPGRGRRWQLGVVRGHLLDLAENTDGARSRSPSGQHRLGQFAISGSISACGCRALGLDLQLRQQADREPS